MDVEEEAHTAVSSKCICSAAVGVAGGDVCIVSIGGADGDTSMADGCAQGVNRGALQKKTDQIVYQMVYVENDDTGKSVV